MPLAGDDDGFADCAAGAAGLADHEAFDQQEAERGIEKDWLHKNTFEIFKTCNVVRNFGSVDEILVWEHANKATKLYLYVVC